MNFKDFFIKQSGMVGEYKRKHITIFTYDGASDQQIRNSIRNAKVDLTQLFRRNDIKFIQTQQMYNNGINEKQKFELFAERLKKIKEHSILVPMPNPNMHRI